jgi:hypothetical protein
MTTTLLQPTDEQIDAAAKVLAECMDYPWEHMPKQGRDNMRKNARAVLAAAQPAPEPCYCDRMGIGVPGVSCGDCPRDYKPAQPAHVPDLIRAFNAGYMLGHHDTVEGVFTDIHPTDMGTYHADEVAELFGRSAAPVPPGWMPIETAPKDGTAVLLWRLYDAGQITQAYWRRDTSDGTSAWGGSGWSFGEGCMQPTHWMPLPSPPDLAASPEVP